jgi:hypothetical protein
MALDLDSLIPKDTLEVDLLHPGDGTPLGATITLAGPSHPATLAIQRAQLDKRLKRGVGGMLDRTSAEALKKDGVEQLVARTLGWKGITRHGKELPFSAAAAAEVYADDGLAWIRKQLNEALGDDAAFFGK